MLDPQWGMFIVESIEQVILQKLDRLPFGFEFGQAAIEMEVDRVSVHCSTHEWIQ